VNSGRPMKRKNGLRSPPSNPIGVRDQWTTEITGNQVSQEIISQGGPTIQTHGFTEGLRFIIRRIMGRKEGYSKSLMCGPAN
jgi:hypothetical protein